MTDLNEWGVNVAAVVPGVRIRLFDGDDEGAVTRMDESGFGRMAVHESSEGRAGEMATFQAANVTGVGLVCDVSGPLPAPSWALGFIDFPTAWHLQRQGVIHVDRMCSAVQTWGGFLCDCGAIETEWKRRRTLAGRSA